MMSQNKYSNPEGVETALRRALHYLKPPPELLPSEWAEQNMKIPLGNAIPGALRFANAPYQVEPLNMLADPSCERVTLMWGAQLGKTMLVNCAIGYYIAHEPHSQMMMQPSQGDLHTWLETKLNPMVEANETLQERIAKPRSRDGVNNQAMKSYPGGFLMFSWAGSPRTMRGRSAPKIYCDEVDGYEYTAEGHPVNLLWQRAATFGDQRKLLVTSTPTIKGVSFIEASFEDGDRRRYYIPCPHCDEMQTLKWSNVHWQKDDDGNHLPSTATYACEHCGGTINDSQKRIALKRGKWVAEKPFTGHASYHMNELYSTFRKWSDIVRSFLEKKAMNDIQSFVNVSLAETWEEDGEQADPVGLASYAENYDAEAIPEEVMFLTAGADVQKDRIEVQLVGWAQGGVPYIVDTQAFYGQPTETPVWNELDAYLKRSFSGMKIAQAFIDSGYLTEYVYSFTKPRHGRRIFPCKGDAGTREIVSKPTQSSAQRVMLVKIGIDSVKRTLLALLKNPGQAIHFSSLLDAEFYSQLTAEKMVLRKIKGFDKIEFVKTRDRNEALDMFVYAYAAMVALQPNWKALKVKHEQNPIADETEPPPPSPKVRENPATKPPPPAKKAFRQRRTGRNFATSW